MELSKKGMAAVVGGAVLTVIATAAATWMISTSSAGVDAAEAGRINTIIDEKMMLDSGKTYAQTLTDLDKNVAVLTITVANIDKNVGFLRSAVQQVASDQDEGG